MNAAMTRYQVQAVEKDASVLDCGEPYSRKAMAVRVARHLARNCPEGVISYDVFDLRTELCVFVRKVELAAWRGAQ